MNTVSEPLRKGLSVAYRGIAYLLLGATISATLAFADDQPDRAQGEGQDTTVRSTNTPSNSDDSNATRGSGSAATQQPSNEAPPTAVESSLFSSLFMSGKTQDQFEPLTPKERLVVYAKDLFGPFHLLLAGVSAGITQLQDSPKEWGEGAQGYGIRYANYYGIAIISSILQMGGEDLLHEDNLYYGSGEHGLWKRMKYAVKSSVLARSSRRHATFFGFAGRQHSRGVVHLPHLAAAKQRLSRGRR